ncbi:MAG: hypothetical protein QXY39_08015, partial [Thermofilaceae archaeon]
MSTSGVVPEEVVGVVKPLDLVVYVPFYVVVEVSESLNLGTLRLSPQNVQVNVSVVVHVPVEVVETATTYVVSEALVPLDSAAEFAPQFVSVASFVEVPRSVEVVVPSSAYVVSESSESLSGVSGLSGQFVSVASFVEVPRSVEVVVPLSVFTAVESLESLPESVTVAQQLAVVDVYVESVVGPELRVEVPVYSLVEVLAEEPAVEVVPLREVYSSVDVYVESAVGPEVALVIPVYSVSEVLDRLEVLETQPAPAPAPAPTGLEGFASRFKPLADPESLFKALVAVYAPANFEEEQELRRLAGELAVRYSTLAEWIGSLRPGDPRELARNPLVVGLIRLLEARVLLPDHVSKQLASFFEGLDPGRTLEKLARGEPLDDSDAVVLERVFLLNDFLSKLQYKPTPAPARPFAEVFPGYEYALLVLG